MATRGYEDLIPHLPPPFLGLLCLQNGMYLGQQEQMAAQG